MIQVSIRENGISVTGHAEYGPHGQDIVCAAVSILTQTLIKSVEGLTKDKIEYDISPGKADIRYGNLSEKSQTLVDSFFVGVLMIADEYSDYVRIV